MVMLGIDIGGAQIKAGVVDEEGAILAARTIPTPADLDTFLPALHEAVEWLLEATALPAGVGVGCKGIINPDSTQVETLRGSLHFLEGQRLSELIGLPDEVPVFADNAARVALAGEMVWGAALGHDLIEYLAALELMPYRRDDCIEPDGHGLLEVGGVELPGDVRGL